MCLVCPCSGGAPASGWARHSRRLFLSLTTADRGGVNGRGPVGRRAFAAPVTVTMPNASATAGAPAATDDDRRGVWVVGRGSPFFTKAAVGWTPPRVGDGVENGEPAAVSFPSASQPCGGARVPLPWGQRQGGVRPAGDGVFRAPPPRGPSARPASLRRGVAGRGGRPPPAGASAETTCTAGGGKGCGADSASTPSPQPESPSAAPASFPHRPQRRLGARAPARAARCTGRGVHHGSSPSTFPGLVQSPRQHQPSARWVPRPRSVGTVEWAREQRWLADARAPLARTTPLFHQACIDGAGRPSHRACVLG